MFMAEHHQHQHWPSLSYEAQFASCVQHLLYVLHGSRTYLRQQPKRLLSVCLLRTLPLHLQEGKRMQKYCIKILNIEIRRQKKNKPISFLCFFDKLFSLLFKLFQVGFCFFQCLIKEFLIILPLLIQQLLVLNFIFPEQ